MATRRKITIAPAIVARAIVAVVEGGPKIGLAGGGFAVVLGHCGRVMLMWYGGKECFVCGIWSSLTHGLYIFLLLLFAYICVGYLYNLRVSCPMALAPVALPFQFSGFIACRLFAKQSILISFGA
jgi:hypothetical protein